jgi:hypothetical protein
MKKFVSIIVLVCFILINIPNPTFASQQSENNIVLVDDETFLSLEMMIRKHKFMTQDDLLNAQNLSSQVSDDDKIFLYQKYKKNAGLGVGVNFIFPGLGSIILGDYISALIIYICAGIGIPFMVTGFMTNLPSPLPPYMKDEKKQDPIATIQMIVGISLMIFSMIYNFASPFIFSNNFNNNLKKALRYDDIFKDVKLIEPKNYNIYQVQFVSIKF